MRRPAFIARQGRHPSGMLGAIVGRIMAGETASDNEWAVGMLGIEPDDRALDIGTGHGRSLGVMAGYATRGLSFGVDFSDTMLEIARAKNKSLIDAGLVRIENAASDFLPFPDASFDRALSMHTIYFWSPAEPHLAEIARVLKSGGHFVLGFRPGEDKVLTSRFPKDIYTFRDTASIEALLVAAGFEIVEANRRDEPGNSMVWIKSRRK